MLHHRPAVSAVILGLYASSFLSGCLLPREECFVEQQNPINKRSVRFVVAGQTTKTEIIENLGSPTIELIRTPGIAYVWHVKRGGLELIVPAHVMAFSIPLKDCDLLFRIYAVEFDADENVTRAEFLEVPQSDVTGFEAIAEHLEERFKNR